MSMQQQDIPPELVKAMPGVLGSIVALRWIAGSPLQRIASVLGGTSSSWYAGEHLAGWLGVNIGLSGFLVGLFGMAIAAKVFELLAQIDGVAILDRILRRWGL
jgi:hypothetical protein